MSIGKTPFRYDYVGSFLRPEALKKARCQFDEGKIGYEELKVVEEAAITELVQKVKALGYHVITDGEFRRATWHLDFMWCFDGIGHTPTKTGLPFHGEAAMVDDTYLVGKVGLSGRHPFVEHFTFVKQFEDENTVAKQTMPSPAQFLAQFTMPFNRVETEKYYVNTEDLVTDIANAYGKVLQDLYDAGCRNVQFDDCTWGMMADKMGHLAYGTTAEGLKEIQKTIETINPLPGAKEFLDELRTFSQVILISDTFTEFAAPLMKKLGWPTLFCNSLEVAENGEITGHKMRVQQSKLTTVKALQSIGFETIASGDSYNDLGMIRASKAGFLFRSTDKIKAENPDIPAYETYGELLDAIKKAMKD